LVTGGPVAPGRALGAEYLGEGRTRFEVWAPLATRVELLLYGPDEVLEMRHGERGSFTVCGEGVRPGRMYRYRLHRPDGVIDRSDPASRFQPEGVHGPSQVVDSDAFVWDEGDGAWPGLPLPRYVLYEVHVGTFTQEGTFAATVHDLDRLRDLGVTAVEVMPVAQFPGWRNWGYDGAYPFAVQDSYGGPDGLKYLVNECHRRGLAFVLDVVYNHLGPEGNYLRDFGPYFTDLYRTPWGHAVNFDGPGSDHVRRFFLENALRWFEEFHVDALRLDAIHGIVDPSARPFLQELAEAAHARGERRRRPCLLIAESASNDRRVVSPAAVGGLGLDAQWNDDFHHALHTVVTGERDGYYQDFGELGQLASAITEGFVYSGQFSSFRDRRFGSSSRDLPADRFVVFAQNHDQVGNRVLGRRLSTLIPFELQKAVAGIVLLAPYVPLLFMGEEYGETAPFPYFISHSDEELVEAVRSGRREELAAFEREEEPPDPQDEETFWRAKLKRELMGDDRHQALLELHRELLRLRAEVPALSNPSKEELAVQLDEAEGMLMLRRWTPEDEVVAIFNLSEEMRSAPVDIPTEGWRMLLDSAEQRWQGPGSSLPAELAIGPADLDLLPMSFCLYGRSGPGATGAWANSRSGPR
jgi:maltooligosyltrehalose trehalohydrolase